MIWLAVFRKLYNHRYQPRTITCRNFANYYLTSLNDLQSNNFEPVFNSSSVNEAWSFLKSILKKCIDGHAPIIRDCLAPRPLSFDENVRAKEGGKETTGETCFACHLYPSHGPLRFITSHSRFALASAMRKTKRLKRTLNYRPLDSKTSTTTSMKFSRSTCSWTSVILAGKRGSRRHSTVLARIETLRSQDSDGSENVAEKVNSCSFNLHRDYSRSPTLLNVGDPS